MPAHIRRVTNPSPVRKLLVLVGASSDHLKLETRLGPPKWPHGELARPKVDCHRIVHEPKSEMVKMQIPFRKGEPDINHTAVK